MASKLELNEAARKLKEAGVAERAKIDWDKQGINYFGGEFIKPKTKEAKK